MFSGTDFARETEGEGLLAPLSFSLIALDMRSFIRYTRESVEEGAGGPEDECGLI